MSDGEKRFATLSQRPSLLALVYRNFEEDEGMIK
jgi:hypothetical protein